MKKKFELFSFYKCSKTNKTYLYVGLFDGKIRFIELWFSPISWAYHPYGFAKIKDISTLSKDGDRKLKITRLSLSIL